MARYRTRSPQDASKKCPGKISINRKPRHPDNALYAISHIHLVEHRGQRQYFPIREVYETVKHLHAERNDEVALGKYLERAIHTHILKTFVNARYLEFDDLKTHIKVTPAGSAFLRDVAEKVQATEYDSKVIEHRAHCDYFRQQVGPLAKLTNKELSDEVEDLQEKLEEFERHQRTCPTFTSSQPFQRASSVATELSSDAGGFDDLPHLQTPDSSRDAQLQETEDGRNADAEILPPPELFSQSFSTPAPASRRPVQSTPFNNPYMTPETIPRMRPQRTITQATITPPPSPPYGNRRSLTPQAPATEHVEDFDMMLDDYADPDTTLVYPPGEDEYQELSTLREENKAYKNWTHQLADLVKPWWGDQTFNPSDIDETSNSACRVVSNLQFAEADVLERDKQLQSLQNDLDWTKAAADAQIESLQIAVQDAENELIAYQLERKRDLAEIQDLKDTLEATKGMLANAIKERDEAVEQIRSIFMGAGKFLKIPTGEPTSISAGPVLRGA